MNNKNTYYERHKEDVKEYARNCNRYKSMSEEDKQKLKEYGNMYCNARKNNYEKYENMKI